MIYIHKKIENPVKDGIEIGEEIKNKVGNPSLIICITSILDEKKLKDVFSGLKRQISLDNLIGCSAGGTFNGKNYIKEDGILMLVFDEHYKSAVSCEKVGKDPEYAGKQISERIRSFIKNKYAKLEIDDNFLGFVFFDWDGNSEQEILDVLGRELTIPIIGGTASDDGSFSKFFQIFKGEVVKNCCVFGVVGGRLKYELIYGHGYEPTNIYARVTKAEGKVVYELDGKPAYIRYLEMISEYSKIPIEKIKKYFYRELKHIGFYLIHPLGLMEVNGNYITAYLEGVKENALVFRRKILEGSFLVLMKTSICRQIASIFEEIKKSNEFNDPLIFINECYAREMLKNKKFLGLEEDIPTYLIDFYANNRDFEEYIVEENLVGWLSYGETIAKDLIRFHNNLSFTGVIFEKSQIGSINWKEELKNFDFDDDEIEVIVNLIHKQLTAKELLHLTKLSQTKLYHTLNKLESEGVIKSIGGKPKLYYIDNIKEMLEKTHEKIEHENTIKKIKRKKLLRIL
ncbi:MAG: hypothetical protein GXN95_01930 [Methanococci archaeon]|nr:hypothetical protein [Methanococci archaeon]